MNHKSKLILISFFILFYMFAVIQDYNQTQLEDADTFMQMHKLNFDQDLLVSIEIQKTGTSEYNRQIQTNLKCIKNNEWTQCCQDGCKIKNGTINDIWYYSYHKSGRHECGLHPDYTALSHCIPRLYPKKNLYYFTRIREPIQRYISEWSHLIRVNAWNIKHFKTFCQIKNDLCFDTYKKSRNITLKDFVNCPTNPGNNRMCRMLAMYNWDNGECYGEGLSGDDMLARAKKTIDKLYWIGLNEYIDESVMLFEKTLSGNQEKQYFSFGNKIKEKTTIANKYINEIEDELMHKIIKNNNLDIQLYEYAHKNFLKRLQFYNIQIKKPTFV
jgi:hypothetical protein